MEARLQLIESGQIVLDREAEAIALLKNQERTWHHRYPTEIELHDHQTMSSALEALKPEHSADVRKVSIRLRRHDLNRSRRRPRLQQLQLQTVRQLGAGAEPGHWIDVARVPHHEPHSHEPPIASRHHRSRELYWRHRTIYVHGFENAAHEQLLHQVLDGYAVGMLIDRLRLRADPHHALRELLVDITEREDQVAGRVRCAAGGIRAQ